MSLRRNRRAKIVATLGPASSDRDTLRSLFHAGVDVFRLNFSHGSAEDHAVRMAILREIEVETGRPIGVMADLQGPKLRVGAFAQGRRNCSPASASAWTWTRAPATPSASVCPPEIFAALVPGAELLDDGRLRLRVDACDAASADTQVLVGGRRPTARASTCRAWCCRSPRSRPDLRDLDGAGAGRRLDRAVLRAAARGHHRGPRTDRRPRPHHRQAGEALGGRAAGRDHRPGRCADGGARRPGRGTAGRTGARYPEARRALPPRRQAGDRGHADAGIHDRKPRAHAPRPPTWPPPSTTARTPSCCRPNPPPASTAGRGRDDEPHHRGHRGRSAVPPADRRIAPPPCRVSRTRPRPCAARCATPPRCSRRPRSSASPVPAPPACGRRANGPRRRCSASRPAWRAAADAGVGRAFRARGRRGRHRAVHPPGLRRGDAGALLQRRTDAGDHRRHAFGKAGTTNLLRIATA